MSNAIFLPNGTSYKVGEASQAITLENLPTGNYALSQDDYGNFWFSQIDSFTLPEKLYGDCTRNADRIIETFNTRKHSTGVLLTGEKGSGKTLLAKTLSMKLAEQNGVVTLVVNQPWCGEGFNNLLQSIKQPMVVLFDEFEKVYDRDKQDKILTLLDGVFSTRKLFVFTSNDRWGINTFMRNRPGRIFYSLDFEGLDINFVKEYCQDNLVNKDNIDSVCQITGLAKKFNFDMLQSLVEEMNRYNETAKESLRLLNIEIDDGHYEYEVEVLRDGKVVPKDAYTPHRFQGNPLDPEGFSVAITNNKAVYQVLDSQMDCYDDDELFDCLEGLLDGVGDPKEVMRFKAGHENLKAMDSIAGKYTFNDPESKMELNLVKIHEVKRSYLDMLY